MALHEVIEATRSMLRTLPYVLVCTTGEGGEVNARQVQLLGVEDDLTIWFSTSPRSRKVADIGRTGRATFVAEDLGRIAYVSVHAGVTMVDDVDERIARWHPDLAPFFPGGPEGDDFVLVRARADRLEVMDFSAGITPAPYGLVPAVVVRDGEGWRTATHDRRD